MGRIFSRAVAVSDAVIFGLIRSGRDGCIRSRVIGLGQKTKIGRRFH